MPMRLAFPVVLLSLVAACASTDAVGLASTDASHPGEAWWPVRAAALGISVDEARARDAAISVEEPPGTPDAMLATEAAALWRDVCASCHGARGRLENVPEAEPMPRAWGGMGARMGFLFGGDGMRAGIYRRISEGGAAVDGVPSKMQPWGERLSREQIWALVAHIEGL